MIPILMLLMSAPEPIDYPALRWDARLIVVHAANEDEPSLQSQAGKLDQARQALAERDVRIIRVIGDRAWIDDRPVDASSAESTRQRFRIAPGEFVVLLIGKDGGVKLREKAPVDVKQIVDLIDSMPMRQQEMRDRPATRERN